MAVFGKFLAPYDPLKMDIGSRLAPPSFAHLLGTDQYGRDLFTRIVRGAGSSLLVGIIAVGIGLGFGVCLGSLAAFWEGLGDELLMRVVDVLYGFPPLLTAILITTILGPSLANSMIAIGIFNIPIFARLTRGSFLSLKERGFVEAARAMGKGELKIVGRHILPNMISPLIIQATTQFSLAILAGAALSYLGLGTQPPHPSWGLMLKQAQTFIPLTPWPAIFPGISIVIAVLGLNLIGDGLRDVLDPRL